MFNDTIAAISTAHGTGGIGIIRISGVDAFNIAERIFSGKRKFNEIKTHTINFGKIIDPDNGEIIDEVLLSKMSQPNTFTKEDVIEINCHGGIIVLKNLLNLVVKEGARLAGPGEFTQRAFLNGRMDLSQAEAVIDLINAKTIEGSKAAISQLEGRLSRELKVVRQKLIEFIARIEVTVDYPEHDVEEITGQEVYSEILVVKENLRNIIQNFEKGRIIREGINIVIVGRPNVGKSSLMNELSGKTKAIVTDIPGTTRDIIEEFINIKGIPVRLADTAGIRETLDPVEIIGVEKAETALNAADLILLIFDASQGIMEEDLNLLKRLENKKNLILLNKIDLVSDEKLSSIEKLLVGQKLIKTSIKDNIGISELESGISDLFLKGEIDLNNELLITNIRHKHLIDKAIKSIDEACIAQENQMPLDCVAIDIKNAAEHLGEITGETVSEDVMKEIFSRFCIGK